MDRPRMTTAEMAAAKAMRHAIRDIKRGVAVEAAKLKLEESRQALKGFWVRRNKWKQSV